MPSDPTTELPSLRSIPGRERQRLKPVYLQAFKHPGPSKPLKPPKSCKPKRVKEKPSIQPFRFLDLPTEVQDMVYSIFAAQIEKSHDRRSRSQTRRLLSSTQIPPLAQVCQEVRSTFLNILFKEGKFTIVIGRPHDKLPNWMRVVSWPSQTLLRRMFAAKDLEDPLYLSQTMAGLLNNSEFVVRDVIFSYSGLHYVEPQGPWYRGTVMPEPRELTMELGWFEGKLKVNGELITHQAPAMSKEMRKLPQEVAEEVCKREEFKGFTVTDLRKIATSMIGANAGVNEL